MQKRRSLEGGGEVVEKGDGMGNKTLLFMIYLKKSRLFELCAMNVFLKDTFHSFISGLV